MKSAVFGDIHPFSRLLLSFFIILLSFLFIILAGALLAIPIFHINIFQHPEALDIAIHPENIPASKYFQILQALSIFVLPPLLSARLFGQDPLSYLKIRFRPPWLLMLLAGTLMFAALPLIGWMIRLNEMLNLPESFGNIENWMREAEESRQALTEAYLAVDGFGGFLVNIFMIGILAAIGEELLFRGLIQRLLTEWFGNLHAAVILTALLFSAMHLQFFGFIPRFALGLLLGYLLVWSGSLWVPIFAHFVNNASAVMVYFLSARGKIAMDPEEFGNVESQWLFFASVCMLITLMLVIYIRRIRYSDIAGKQKDDIISQ